MATSGLYGNTAASVVALPSGSETSGLYGNNTVFGGTYFEYFIFQDAATQPATPTGGSWSFTTNTGTPPTGWSNNPPASPTNKVWISIALVNSKSTSTLTWSTPGVMATTAAGTVTSVGLSAPSFLSVSGSPITTNGTLALSYSGTALPVANGGTGTTTPNLTAGTNVTITGTWPNQTINSTNPGGTVTSVTATSPVLSTGGTTPVISLPAATSSVNGYLTSTDWTTFNNKGSGSVTSVALTAPSFLSVTGSPITSNGTLALSYSGTALPVANGGTGVTTSTGSGNNVLSTSPTLVTPNLGIPASVTLTNATGLPLSTGVTGTLPIANGGTGTTTPSLVAGTNVTITGSWPNQTINSTGGGGGGSGTVTSVAATVPSFLSVTGSPITTSGTLAIGYSGTALPVANGGTGVTASTGANSVVLRDANQNITVNALNEGFTSVAASGTAITLTASSNRRYTVTGSGGQVITLPNATTLQNGNVFYFDNNQTSGSITVNNNSGTLVVSVPSGSYVSVYLLDNSIAAGSWDRHDAAPSNVSWSTNTFDYPGSITSATWNGATVAYNRGGTGLTSFTSNGVVYASSTSALATGSALTFDGTNLGVGTASPSYKVDVSGTLHATGLSTFDNAISLNAASLNYLYYNSAISFAQNGTGERMRIDSNGNFMVGITSSSNKFTVSGTNASGAIAGQIQNLDTGGSSATQFNVYHGSGANLTAQAGNGYTALINTTAIPMLFQTNNVEQMRLGLNASAVNSLQITGSATTKATQIQTIGSDSNVSLAVQPKGTGAIDLAAGSSGVNISNGGTVTAITRTNGGTGYTVAPTVVISAPTTAGGTQATATCTVTAGVVDAAFTITNAGSGYVEQPTITFTPVSGGSGAAAYATVGSIPTIKTVGSALSFATPSGEAFRVSDIGVSTTTWIETQGGTTTARVFANAASGNIDLRLSSRATGSITFYTNANANQQFNVSHTASAVNYVQVTGAATGAAPVISSQGSDAAVGLTFNTKSTGVYTFQTNGTTRLLVNSGGTVQLGYANATPCFTAAGTASQVNGFQVAGSVAGSAPVLSSTGTDTNIDLTLTPKGTGRVNITTSIKPKVNSAASVTSPLAWDSTSYDEYAITALANALTINADANASPADGQRMMFRFKDNGTARALTWTTGATNAFRVVGVTLPTTTVASKLVYIGCIYNAADSRWDVVAVSQEA